MPSQAPPIDPRSRDQVIAETEQLVRELTGYRPAPGDRSDPGRALIHIFGRLSERVIQRLNRVPERNLLAFLDLIGVAPLPPQAARVPLSFTLAAGSPVDAFVPAGTRVAAPAEGTEGEVLYETERDLVVMGSRLAAVLVRDPGSDRYGDYGAAAAADPAQPFPAFAGDRAIAHALYLARDDLLTLPGPKQLSLDIAGDLDRLEALPVSWSYWDGEVWRELAVRTERSRDRRLLSVDFAPFPPADQPQPAPLAVDGIEAAWLRMELAVPFPAGDLEAPSGADGRRWITRRELVPDPLAVGDPPAATALPCFPFGEAEESTAFHLALDEPFLRAEADLELQLVLAEAGRASDTLVLAWDRFADGRWRELGRSGRDGTLAAAAGSGFVDDTRALTRDGAVRFRVPAGWTATAVAGRDARWLRVRVVQGNFGTGTGLQPPRLAGLRAAYRWELPRIGGLTLRLNQVRADIPPDRAFANALALDLGKDFLPFGEKPRFNDCLYLASDEVFSKTDAEQVTLAVTLSDPAAAPVKASKDLVLAWEAWNGGRWEELGRSGPDVTRAADRRFVDDGSAGFTKSGSVTLKLPAQLRPTRVNAEPGHWLRVRMVRGNYGQEAHYRQGRDDQGQPRYEPVAATFAPPSLAALTLGYTYRPGKPPAACLGYNDFRYHDGTAAAAGGRLFTPFLPPDRLRPALYLGFDRPLPNRSLALHAQVAPVRYGIDAAAGAAAGEPVRVAWEYAGAEGWTRLGARDESEGFCIPGSIGFIGPADLAPRTEFGRTLYWLRARWEAGDYPVMPRLDRLLTNTTWAAQATTVVNETLGSGNGEPGLRFRTVHAPLLQGVRIEVLESEPPAPEERRAILAEEGGDAITPAAAAAGRSAGVWVRWHQVANFHGSGPRDRHFVLDHAGGEVRFGDGQRGRVPPPGRNNVRAARYRSGGGIRGNRAAGSVTQLKTAVPYVDGVTNHEAAAGGADGESLDQVKRRGPRTLRHRGRAVTAADYEDLALAASPRVARARALLPHYDPLAHRWQAGYDRGDAGGVGLVIVPRDQAARPIPTLELMQRVERYLLERSDPAARLRVAGPDWVRVTVSAKIVPSVPGGAADAAAAGVADALERYLHPLTGGGGDGWDFGRKPHKSALYALIESQPGVDHVRELAIREEPVGEVHDDRFLVFSGRHAVALVAAEEV